MTAGPLGSSVSSGADVNPMTLPPCAGAGGENSFPAQFRARLPATRASGPGHHGR